MVEDQWAFYLLKCILQQWHSKFFGNFGRDDPKIGKRQGQHHETCSVRKQLIGIFDKEKANLLNNFFGKCLIKQHGFQPGFHSHHHAWKVHGT